MTVLRKRKGKQQKIVTKIYLTKNLYPEHMRNFCNSIARKQPSFSKLSNNMNRHCIKEDIQVANMHGKTSLAIRKTPLKPTKLYGHENSYN